MVKKSLKGNKVKDDKVHPKKPFNKV